MVKKIALGSVGVMALAVMGLAGYVQLNWDRTYDVPYPDLAVSTDSAVIARGRYLVHGPAHCSNCHVGSFDEMVRADVGEDVPMRGGVPFAMPPLGTIAPANLTPDPETGIGRYSDGQLFRMLRHAVKPNDRATLSLMMPFWNMADEDLVAIVSYLRSLEPVYHPVPEPDWTFVGKAIITFAPLFKPVLDPRPPPAAPREAPTAERGEYLARYVANCVGCHTKRDPMTFEAVGPEFAGGMEFEPEPETEDIRAAYERAGARFDPALWMRSPNLTPHPTGILDDFGSLTAWINRFRTGRTLPQSPMHWGPFSRMTDTDLEALWVFLNGLDPVDNDLGPTVFRKGSE